eukprot:SAG22_NODE_2202_length_2843_cov_2.716108_1_plen_92_part_00
MAKEQQQTSTKREDEGRDLVTTAYQLFEGSGNDLLALFFVPNSIDISEKCCEAENIAAHTGAASFHPYRLNRDLAPKYLASRFAHLELFAT